VPRQTITLSGESIDRTRIERLLQDDALLVFEDCDFSNADLSRLNLQDSVFKNCALPDTSFYAANLARTRWQRCRAGHADFESGDLVDARFEACDLNNTSWRRAKLASCTYRSCKLTDADLSGCDFREAVFEGGSLRDAHIKDTRFEGADLREADLGGLKLVNAKLFAGATISPRQAAELVRAMGLSVA
jgi:fluoroquinolone resistance protein